jgi:hypothetical protein
MMKHMKREDLAKMMVRNPSTMRNVYSVLTGNVPKLGCKMQ